MTKTTFLLALQLAVFIVAICSRRFVTAAVSLVDGDVTLRVFAAIPDPDTSVVSNPGADVEVSIQNRQEQFIVELRDKDRLAVCRGVLVSGADEPIRCHIDGQSLHHGDNALQLSIFDFKSNELVLETTSHFFYPHGQLPVYWYHPALEKKASIAAISLLALAKYSWARHRGRVEVIGEEYDQPKLTYIQRVNRPTPALAPLPPRLCLTAPLVAAPPSVSLQQAQLNGLRQDGLRSRGWRWMTYGAVLGAGIALGRPMAPLGTSPAILPRASLPSYLDHSYQTPPPPPPHPSLSRPDSGSSSAQRLASTLPVAALLGPGAKWRLLAVCAAQAVVSAVVLKKGQDTPTRFLQNAGIHDGFIPFH